MSLMIVMFAFTDKRKDSIGSKEKNSLYLGSNENGDEDSETLEGDYIDIEDELLVDALVDISYDEDEEKFITTIDQIYGVEIEENKLIQIAKTQIATSAGADIVDFSNITSVTLENALQLYDANDFNSCVAYNFTTINNKEGYIILSKHTKAPLIREIVYDTQLPIDSNKIYYFSEGEFYFLSRDFVNTLEDTIIDLNEFNVFKEERKKMYFNYTIDMLATIEIDTISMLNNITYLNENSISNEELFLSKKTYDGQVGNGYGGISSPKKYLKDRYGGTISKKSSKSLNMNNYICGDFSEKNNCTLVAITRVLEYYYNQGYTKLPSSYKKIYNKVVETAKDYGYTEEKGTFPTKINNIIDDVLDYYGYKKSYSDGIYVWSFNYEVKSQIDKNKPVIMNIVRGYYGNHSVTVSGYAIYKSKHEILFTSYSKTHNLIRVYDGWDRGARYIDYEAFAYDLVSAGFGSFNTITMKK